MPIKDYGVWKAKPVRYTYETNEDDQVSPHLSLFFADGEDGEGRAAVNIKSGDRQESRLASWILPEFQHPITQRLASLDDGFHPLTGTAEQGRNGLALDFVRGNLFQRSQGRILPHDIPGANNDILDVLKPILDQAIADHATVHIYGSHFNDGKGIHNNHQNQGNPKRFAKDNGVYQDGGIIIQFADHWAAIFIGFASQAIHTEDGPAHAGYPIPRDGYKTWADFLLPEGDKGLQGGNDIADSPVAISAAVVNPEGPDNQPGGDPETVTLKNRTAAEVDLTGWSIRNKTGLTAELQPGLRLATGASATVELPGVPLSNQGGIITLLNAHGLKVHGVAYTRDQAREGGVVSFA
ncbi:hypothetical protein B0T25DRAFT_298094 [Lasiosphaeria hispida]|uniref:LTD domain-containing protein n=1 Tax=Lasiosphaeria hispida TaxID=260671 RepID=A0AAJ0HDH8_9PEZI|nr:hypothetical protein B0T25DRAFT_298094 [Lasiosphaeria hispida]